MSARANRRGLRDVVVVGGGVVGASAALALAAQGLDVVLLETTPPPAWDAATPDLRVYALAPDNIALLDRLGLWSQIRRTRAQAYHQMRVWDGAGGGELVFDADHLGCPELGWIVESSLLLDRLWAAFVERGLPRWGFPEKNSGGEGTPLASHWLAALPNARRASPGRNGPALQSQVEVICPARVESIQPTSTHVHLRLDSGSPLDARLVIAADGGNSSIRTLAGIETRTHHYGQRGIVGYMHSEHPHQHTAWQRFLPTGPLALLPCPGDGHQLSIVWTLPDAEASRVMALDDNAFARELTTASAARLGALRPVSKRAAFALKRQLAHTQHSGRIVLLGDAAHVVHPLAGQGVNLGLRDVTALHASIHAAQQRQSPWDSPERLARWARARRSDNTRAAWTFDGINRIFSNDAVLPTLLRGHLLSAAQHLPGVSFLLGRHALK